MGGDDHYGNIIILSRNAYEIIHSGNMNRMMTFCEQYKLNEKKRKQYVELFHTYKIKNTLE